MAFDFPASPTTGQLFTPAGGPTYVWDGAKWAVTNTSAQPVYAPQGRITLTSGAPVMLANVAGGTIIYYTPYIGYMVPVWNGTIVQMVNMGAELSQALNDTTKSPAAAVANKNYDIFFWMDGSTPRATRGPAWTSDTARATALVRGVLGWLNAAAITNGPGAQLGTYLGTIRTNAAGTIDWNLGGANTPAQLTVWNYFNRVPIAAAVTESAATWAPPAGGALRALNANNNIRVNFLIGVVEQSVAVAIAGRASIASGNWWQGSVGLDSVTVTGIRGQAMISGIYTVNVEGTTYVRDTVMPSLGWHFYQYLEAANTTGGTVVGANGAFIYFDGMF